ncbi:hypothetical protein GCM10009710_33340 [Aeromicrobium alkaliterrae]|uniref:NAD(P)-binding domain-containing protein n=1 Tax=Aeromicrobium alkaliterrae TaxID=302168 RepID=A0ABN2K8Z6_9ACTN
MGRAAPSLGAAHPARVVAADATDPVELRRVVAGSRAVVVAITPFSSPEELTADLDRDFFAGVVRTLDLARVARVVGIGLFATLVWRDGTRVMDDPELFPPFLHGYGESRLREIAALEASDLDWALLTPPAGLSEDVDESDGYRLGSHHVSEGELRSSLDYDTLALAVVAEVVRPTAHREQVVVLPA